MTPADRTSGYVTGIDYVDTYILHHNPNFARFLLLVQGVKAPKFARALELGFGTGFSLGLTAAAQPDCAWWGNDFNPSHVAAAQEMTAGLDPKPHLLESSFEEMVAAIDELPEFDFICLHGIWSWVSQDTHKTIVSLIARRLKPGGVISVGHNIHPYWAAIVPLRNLLALHVERQGGKGRGISEDLNAAMTFASRLAEISPKHYQMNPLVPFHLEIMKRQDPKYLPHEYLHQSWIITDFAQVTASFEAIGLTYAGHADAEDLPDAYNLTPQQSSFINAIEDPVMRETVRDLTINRKTRHDFWVKGGVSADITGRDAALREFKLVAIVPRGAFHMTVNLPAGETMLREDVYAAVADILKADGYRPKSLGEIAAHLAATGAFTPQQAWSQTIEAACVFLGLRYTAVLAPDAGDPQDSLHNCANMNQYLISRVRAGTPTHMVSPVAGGAVLVDGINTILVEAMNGKMTDAARMADHVMERLFADRDPGMDLDITRQKELRAQIDATTRVFLDEYAPLYTALGITRGL